MIDESIWIHTASGEFAAQQVKAFLGAHGIPCLFRGEALRHIHGFTLDGLGEVRILVDPELAERARELLGRVESGELTLEELPDDTKPDDTKNEDG